MYYPSFDLDQVESKLSERKRPWVAKKLLDKTCIILALTLIKSKATEKHVLSYRDVHLTGDIT